MFGKPSRSFTRYYSFILSVQDPLVHKSCFATTHSPAKHLNLDQELLSWEPPSVLKIRLYERLTSRSKSGSLHKSRYLRTIMPSNVKYIYEAVASPRYFCFLAGVDLSLEGYPEIQLPGAHDMLV